MVKWTNLMKLSLSVNTDLSKLQGKVKIHSKELKFPLTK